MIVILTAILAFLATSSAVFAAPRVSVSFSGEKIVTNVNNFQVLAKVTNTGDETLTLLNDPHTLLTPHWRTKSFHITSAEGAVPRFKGVKVKWSPTAAVRSRSFTVIGPGHTVGFSHSLGGMYDFMVAGEYDVVPTREAATFTHVTASGELISLRADIADAYHSAILKGKFTPTAYTGGGMNPSSLNKRANTFHSCDSAQQSAVGTAVVNAQTYADNAYTYLAGISATTVRYETWFGAYTSPRKSTVETHFSNIRDGQFASYTFNCSCTESDTYAYVDEDVFGYVWLCPEFWPAPATGTDSKAGTIVHEATHFTVNGGTDDVAYGQADCKALAISNPDQAIRNADNHQYFAENNPPLA